MTDERPLSKEVKREYSSLIRFPLSTENTVHVIAEQPASRFTWAIHVLLRNGILLFCTTTPRGERSRRSWTWPSAVRGRPRAHRSTTKPNRYRSNHTGYPVLFRSQPEGQRDDQRLRSRPRPLSILNVEHWRRPNTQARDGSEGASRWPVYTSVPLFTPKTIIITISVSKDVSGNAYTYFSSHLPAVIYRARVQSIYASENGFTASHPSVLCMGGGGEF